MQQVWAVTMVRDEQDVIAHTLQHLIGEGVNGIIVADNLSTDATRDEIQRVAQSAPVPVLLQSDDEPGYYQSEKMTRLAALAAGHGADWIIPFDADELWIAEDRLATVLRRQPEGVGVVHARILNHFATALDLDDPVPFRSMIYRHREVGALPKVAYRWNADTTIQQGNHGVTGAKGAVIGAFEVRHFPYRTFEQFMRKARNGAEAYRSTTLPEQIGAHWRQYGELLERHGEDALREVWQRWFWFLAPCDSGMILDPAPLCRWEI